MAKRRNSKLKSVVAVVELEEPAAGMEDRAQTAPLAAVEDQRPAEALPAFPAIAGIPAPIAPSAATPDVTEVAPVLTTEETIAVGAPPQTAPAIALEAVIGNATISEPAALAETIASVDLDPETAATETVVGLAELGEIEATIPAASVVVAEPAPSSESPSPDELARPGRRDADAPTATEPSLAKVARAPWFRRLPAYAVSVSLAAAFGVIVGSLTASALLPATHVVSAAGAQEDAPRATVASVDRLAAEVAALKQALAVNAAMVPASTASGNADGLSRDIAVLKASFGQSESGANARLLELVAQVNRTEKAEADLAARIARIEKPSSAKADVSSEVTGSVDAASPPIADGWVLWRVYGGRAVVQGRSGVFDVVPGAELPDLGLVREITQRDGRWVVITENGVIVPAPARRLG